MDRKTILKYEQLWQEVVEKKKLDPVDHKALKGKYADRDDKDIDNDGDQDSSDEYLHNRRATIQKKMKHSRSGKLGGHDVGESKDLDSENVLKALKHDCATHVQHEQWGAGECISGQHTLEEQEDGTAIVTHYDVMFEHGIEFDVAVESLKVTKSEAHLHAAKKMAKKESSEEQDEACWDSHKQVGMKKKGDRMVPNCVPKEEVEHEEEVIAENTVAEFEEEVVNAYSGSINGIRAALTQMWEKAQQAKHGSEGKYKDDQFGQQPQAAKDFAAQHDYGKAELVKDDEEGHQDALKAAKAGTQSPARKGDQRKGDLKIVNPVKGSVQ